MHSRRLVVVPHTHWDREWYMPFERFRMRLVAMIDHLLRVLESDRDFTCFELDGQTILLDDYLAVRPENRRRLEKLVRQGRIIIGPWYIQPDEFLVSGESIIRNLRLGIRSAKQYGKVSLVGYLPDQFGHIGQMPQILANFGITSAIVWRGVGNTVKETEFLWEAPDGTQLFSVYLADSYSNGAYLPLKPKELSERLAKLMERLSPYSKIKSMLIMNGLDHLEPQDNLPEKLEKAMRRLKGVTFEIGSFSAFIKQARAQANSMPVHYGEFRSSERAPLLPGVTSTRIRQKQRAFRLSGLLEKYVEPLCAWALLRGDERPHQNFVEHAWRLTLQNQPHDSICGCSVDAVHEEMDTRFDRAEQVAKALQKDALSYLAARMDTRGASAEQPVLCLFNPTSAANQLVDVEVDLEEPDFAHSVVDAGGAAIPLQKVVGDREIFVQTDETPEAVRQLVSGMVSRELIGFYINNVLWRVDGDILRLNLIMGRAPAGEVDFDRRRKQLLAALEDPAIAKVEIRGISGAKTRLIFPAADLAPLGLTVYSLSDKGIDGPTAHPAAATENGLENQYYRISIQNDGAITILDKETGIRFNRCLQFVDEADRGDTYTFDEVAGGRIIDAPAGPVAVSVIESGPVRASARIEARYEIPRRLTPERDTRIAETVETAITTTISLPANVKRIDFAVSLDNQCEDHRLRALFRAPFDSNGAFVESAFGVVHRPSANESGEGFVERPTGASPQKCFSCVEDGAAGMALFNRGIPEVEAVACRGETILALTLLRSVGWLSRDDLASRPVAAGPQFLTPGAQSKGLHSFEFAFTSYSGGFADADIVKQAHAFAFSPVAALTDRHRGALKNKTSLAALDNPHIVVSSVEMSAGKNAFLVRLYNSTASHQQTQLKLGETAASVDEVNFLEKKTAKEPLKLRGGKCNLSLRPAEIKTLRARVNK